MPAFFAIIIFGAGTSISVSLVLGLVGSAGVSGVAAGVDRPVRLAEQLQQSCWPSIVLVFILGEAITSVLRKNNFEREDRHKC